MSTSDPLPSSPIVWSDPDGDDKHPGVRGMSERALPWHPDVPASEIEWWMRQGLDAAARAGITPRVPQPGEVPTGNFKDESALADPTWTPDDFDVSERVLRADADYQIEKRRRPGLTEWEEKVLAAPGAPDRVAQIEKELRPAADPVGHPAHYTSHPSGVECITITEHMGFNLGNAFKYIWRADLKSDALEDLRKAAWYVDREIARRETWPTG